MSLEIRKKSNSFSNYQPINQQRTIIKNSKANPLSSCRSVSAFNQNTNIITNRKHIQKFSIENKSFCHTKRNYESMKNTSNQNSIYKEAIQKRKKKSLSANKNFQQQLFRTIDAFQLTLCSLPLDKLILSQNPFQWVEQQVKTLQKLSDKLKKVQFNSKNQTCEYYFSKLSTVTNILTNIKQNLETLDKMNLLKNYTSGGTSMQSRNSHSSTSLVTTSNFSKDQQQINNIKNKTIQGRNFATQYQKSDQQGSSQRQQYDKQNMINFANQCFQKNHLMKPQKAKITIKQAAIVQKDKFVLQNYHSSSQRQLNLNNMETIRSDKSFQQQPSRENHQNRKSFKSSTRNFNNQNQNNSNRTQNQLEPRSFVKSSTMGKTVSKYPKKLQQQNQLNTFFNSHQSKQSFNTLPYEHFQTSISIGQQTKRHTASIDHQLGNQLLKIKMQLDIKNQLIINLQRKNQKILATIKQQFNKKQKHYLQTIYDLKKQSKQKQISIKQLLIQIQTRNDIQQISSKQLHQKKQINQNLISNIQLLENSIQSLTNQLRQYKIREQQLRQTVQLERQRTQKSYKSTQQLQQNIETLNKKIINQNEKNQILNKKIEQLTKNLQLLQHSKQKNLEKQEVYKKMYYKLYSDSQKFKEKIKQDNEYWKKICLNCKKSYKQKDQDTEKPIQLRELINFHKKRLLQ